MILSWIYSSLNPKIMTLIMGHNLTFCLKCTREIFLCFFEGSRYATMISISNIEESAFFYNGVHSKK